MSEWTECTLGDVVTLQRGYDLPSRVRRQGCYPVVSSSGTTDWHAEYKVEGPGVVTGRYGTIGEVFYVAGKYWPLNTTLFVSDFKGNVPRFVYYLLKLFDFKKFSDKSAVPGVNRNDLYPTKIRLPRDRETQESIALVLHSLDDKIEHNNELIKMLEEQAQLVYDYWFMQFDFPDENGRPYRSSGGKMVWNEVLKRELPEGWRVERLSEHAHITMGTSPVGSSLNELQDGMLFFQGSTDFGSVIPEARVYTTSPKRTANAGDLLFSVRAPVGSMNFAAQECCIGRGLAALSSAIDAPAHLWQEMRCLAPHFDKYNLEGSIFGCIGRDALHALPVLTPNIPLIEKYQKEVGAIHERYIALAHENVHLAAQRDFLLPLLMSGQVTVAE